MQTKPGLTLRSTTSEVEVIVVRGAAGDVDITCGGASMTADGEAGTGGDAGNEETAVLLGKRYADDEAGLELLCTKPGAGPLACDGRMLAIKGTKPLPASD